MKLPFSYSIIILFICTLTGSRSLLYDQDNGLHANNIILFIGDGMGEAQRTAARWTLVGENGLLAMDDMPFHGLSKTNAVNSEATDSAAAATAMATGIKTNKGVLGLDAELSYVTTILEEAKKQGKMVGLVTTTQITHATPAAFAVHIEDREQVFAIAEQIILADINVLLGGGEDDFLPESDKGCFPEPGKRKDGRNLLNEAVSKGYTYICDPDLFIKFDPSSATHLIGGFSDEGMKRPYSPSLAEMTRKAIKILSKNPKGFFLMVESGQIDWAAHLNDTANVISDTLALDEAVRVAKIFSSKDNNTLIIVTADHETGGMRLSLSTHNNLNVDGPFTMKNGKQFYVNWKTRYHTPQNVPVSSLGPSSSRLKGIYENTHIYNVMLDALTINETDEYF